MNLLTSQYKTADIAPLSAGDINQESTGKLIINLKKTTRKSFYNYNNIYTTLISARGCRETRVRSLDIHIDLFLRVVLFYITLCLLILSSLFIQYS